MKEYNELPDTDDDDPAINDKLTNEEKLRRFVDKFFKAQQSLDPETVEMVNRNFWDLI
jgi:hypothetical protein